MPIGLLARTDLTTDILEHRARQQKHSWIRNISRFMRERPQLLIEAAVIGVPTYFYKIVLHERASGFIDTITILLPHKDASPTGQDVDPYLGANRLRTASSTTSPRNGRIRRLDSLAAMAGQHGRVVLFCAAENRAHPGWKCKRGGLCQGLVACLEPRDTSIGFLHSQCLHRSECGPALSHWPTTSPGASGNFFACVLFYPPPAVQFSSIIHPSGSVCL